VPPRRINEIVLGKRSITADTALRPGRYFDMSPQFWLGLQMDYDLDVTADVLKTRLEREAKPILWLYRQLPTTKNNSVGSRLYSGLLLLSACERR
jgi:plasmid maintenance system antidote protein VapI